MTPELDRIYQGSALEVLRRWPDGFVHTCVTSPPYWGLRDYGHAGQLGLEETPEDYVAALVEVLMEVRRVLRPDGTLWLNLGDCYAGSWGSDGYRDSTTNEHVKSRNSITNMPKRAKKLKRVTAPMLEGCGKNQDHALRADEAGRRTPFLKPKDLVGIPWRVAFALQAAGWWLRSDIIWAKKNGMPESVTDRPTRSHEYVFLLSKSERYYYDHEAVKEPCESSPSDMRKMEQGLARLGGKALDNESALCSASARTRVGTQRSVGSPDGRNRRTVWHVGVGGFREAHFATFPEALIKPCILAGSPSGGGCVLDPFMGAGTSALVAAHLNRRFLGIELNPEYVTMAERRVANEVAQVKAL